MQRHNLWQIWFPLPASFSSLIRNKTVVCKPVFRTHVQLFSRNLDFFFQGMTPKVNSKRLFAGHIKENLLPPLIWNQQLISINEDIQPANELWLQLLPPQQVLTSRSPFNNCDMTSPYLYHSPPSNSPFHGFWAAGFYSHSQNYLNPSHRVTVPLVFPSREGGSSSE